MPVPVVKTATGRYLVLTQGEQSTGGAALYARVASAGQKPDPDRQTARLAEWVAEDRPIRHFWIDAAELEARPELVRTMSVRPPTTGGRLRLVEIEGLDLQACGGTHVRSTGEIGALAVGKIENKGRQNRRVNIARAD